MILVYKAAERYTHDQAVSLHRCQLYQLDSLAAGGWADNRTPDRRLPESEYIDHMVTGKRWMKTFTGSNHATYVT
jgi:hypothetical protein